MLRLEFILGIRPRFRQHLLAFCEVGNAYPNFHGWEFQMGHGSICMLGMRVSSAWQWEAGSTLVLTHCAKAEACRLVPVVELRYNGFLRCLFSMH